MWNLSGGKDKLITALVFLTPILVCCVGPISYAAILEIRDPWIDSHMDQYLFLSSDTILETPYITGKIVIINPERKRVDPLHYKLSKELRAQAHEDVGTVVWLQREEKKVGAYLGGGSAYQHVWHVTVIDFKRGVITAKQEIRGSEPPDTVYCRSDSPCNASGDEPTSKVLEYLKSLPQK